jgi:ribosomal protein L34
MKDIRIIRAPVRCTTPIICGEMTNDSKAAKFHECGWIRRANQNGRSFTILRRRRKKGRKEGNTNNNKK